MLFWGQQDKVRAVQYWDTASPYHYVRTEDHPEHGLILIVGGEDHPTGIKPDQYEVGTHQRSPLSTMPSKDVCASSACSDALRSCIG